MKCGKTLNYAREGEEVQEGFDVSRRTEWEQLNKCVAGRSCRGKEFQKLSAEGHVPKPTRLGRRGSGLAFEKARVTSGTTRVHVTMLWHGVWHGETQRAQTGSELTAPLRS